MDSIIQNNKLHEFFNSKGAFVVFYDLYLKQQFNIVWGGDSESKQLITKVIARYLLDDLHANHTDFNAIIKQILVDETMGTLFISSFVDNNIWELEELLRYLDSEYVDFELISSLDKLLLTFDIEAWHKDNILINLIAKIRNDEQKRTSIVDYIKRYAETFKRWDKESLQANEKEMNTADLRLNNYYEILSDAEATQCDRYNAALELSKNSEFFEKKDPQPLFDVIEIFFKELDLDKMTLEKKSEREFTISTFLLKIPDFVKLLYRFGKNDLLSKYRMVLAKTLPSVCFLSNYNSNEIKEIYKSVIGDISSVEKQNLVEWWKTREDDFLNFSSDDICTCIIDYGIEALSYKLEEYIKEYIECQDNEHSIAATKALDIISGGDYGWDILKYKHLFSSLQDGSILSVKMQCNAIMIEKFQDPDAITWRIEY